VKSCKGLSMVLNGALGQMQIERSHFVNCTITNGGIISSSSASSEGTNHFIILCPRLGRPKRQRAKLFSAASTSTLRETRFHGRTLPPGQLRLPPMRAASSARLTLVYPGRCRCFVSSESLDWYRSWQLRSCPQH
jgi:hypothetical protein